MTFTRRKFNRKFRGGKKKTIRRKRKTRRKRRGGATQKQIAAWAEKANKVMAIDDEEIRRKIINSWCMDMDNIEAPLCKMKRGGGRRKSKRKKSKRKKRRKKKTKKRKRRRRQRGGYKCDYPSNVGEIFTGIKLNKNPYLPDPINSNSNIKQRQKGGGFMDNFGMGDALLGWYKGTNAVSNVPIRYKGGKNLMDANPMHQPGLLNKIPVHKTANVPKFYNTASDEAVKNTIS